MFWIRSGVFLLETGTCPGGGGKKTQLWSFSFFSWRDVNHVSVPHNPRSLRDGEALYVGM